MAKAAVTDSKRFLILRILILLSCGSTRLLAGEFLGSTCSRVGARNRDVA